MPACQEWVSDNDADDLTNNFSQMLIVGLETGEALRALPPSVGWKRKGMCWKGEGCVEVGGVWWGEDDIECVVGVVMCG